MLPFQETLPAVIGPLEPVRVAFHDEVIVWPPGSVKPSFQPLMAPLPGLAIVTFAVKPDSPTLVPWVTLHEEEVPRVGPVGGPPPLTAAEKFVTARPAPPIHGSKPAWMLVRYHELV